MLGARDRRAHTAAALWWALGLCAALGCRIPGLGPPTPAAAPGGEAAAPWLTGTRQLTFAGRRAGEGYFAADGRTLVFQSERDPANPFFQIYLLDLVSGGVERVSPGTGKTTCGWIHPEGRRVLFASTHLDPDARAKQAEELEQRAAGTERRYAWDFDPHYDLFAAELEGGELTRLTTSLGYDAEGSYSPDGDWIAFASNRHAFEAALDADARVRFEADPAWAMEIYLMRADGSDARRLTDAPGYDGGPFFSPDGERIVWRRFSEEGDKAEIYSMRVDGTDVRQLTRLGALSWAPFYHPSGDYVIFATNLHGFGNFELYLVDAEGEEQPLRITARDGFDGLPAFSPDGSQLVWTRSKPGQRGGQLFLADWAHEQVPFARRPFSLPARARPAIEAAALRRHVEALSSEGMEGRLTGTDGERRATRYVAAAFERLGLEPAGDDGSYFQSFEFTAGVSLGAGNSLTLVEATGDAHAGPGGSGERFALDEQWRPLTFSSNGRAGPAPVVFAGYGVVAPATSEQAAYDAYGELDVEGRWVAVLRGVPEDVSPERRRHLHRHASLRYKAMLARDRGALGLLVVSGPRSEYRHAVARLGLDASVAGMSLYGVSVDASVGGVLLERAGRDLADLQQVLDTGATVEGFELPGVAILAEIELVRDRRQGRNVIGRLRASPPSDAPPVVVGAHVDHLGKGDGGNSLAREAERGGIHYGADDNASGVAALLEVAEQLAARVAAGELRMQRDLLFAAWSGEELGLLGSDAFVTDFPGPHEIANGSEPGAAAYLNMDMVGRLRDELVVYGVGSSSIWAPELERYNAPIGLPISAQAESYLPTDATNFYLKGVPVLSPFTGAHDEYHTPRDTADRLNYPGLEDISKLVAALAASLAARDELPDYVASARPRNLGARAGLRAYLGTVPSYSERDVPGLALSGVATGGPAETAGLRAGDVVVELGGQRVENIYDYTYAIDALRVGETVEITVLRAGERKTFEITPTSRE